MSAKHDHHDCVGPALTSLDARISLFGQVLREMLDSSILAVETWVIPASGVVERSWHVAYHAVAVSNLSAANVTVTSSPAAAGPPTQGPGIAVIAANKSATHNLAGQALTIYGTAGATVVLSVFTRPQAPAWG